MTYKKPIIIIDDGLNSDLFNLGDLKFDVEITDELEVKNNFCYENDFGCHGSTCAAIIKSYLPNVQFGSVKILNGFKGKRQQLVKAIRWCVENNIKLINLSLGTVNFEDFKLLYSCMDYAHKKGLIIVAAYNNNRIYTCPASFDNVIGVKCDITGTLRNREYFYEDSSLDGIELIASANHNIIDNRGIHYTTPTCNSYATPVISALVYEIIEKYPDITMSGIKSFLKSNAVNKDDRIFTTINSNFNMQKNIEIPLIFFYDFIGNYGLSVTKLFCKLFRQNGYYAIAIIDSILQSSRHEGIISFSEYYSNMDCINSEVIEDIYTIFKCDILISCIHKLNYAGILSGNSYDLIGIPIDINVLIIEEFTSEVENIIKQNSDSEILIFYTKSTRVIKNIKYKVFYDIYELFRYILNSLI